MAHVKNWRLYVGSSFSEPVLPNIELISAISMNALLVNIYLNDTIPGTAKFSMH
jgi:hypothetical protein